MVEARQRPYDGRLNDFEVMNLGSPEPPLLAAVSETEIGGDIKDEDGSCENRNHISGSVDMTVGESHANCDYVVTAQNKKRSSPSPSQDEVAGPEQKRRPNSRMPLIPAPRLYKHVARPLTTMKGHTAFLTFAFAPTMATRNLCGTGSSN
jgi:hypothetical protein